MLELSPDLVKIRKKMMRIVSFVLNLLCIFLGRDYKFGAPLPLQGVQVYCGWEQAHTCGSVYLYMYVHSILLTFCIESAESMNFLEFLKNKKY